jgi:hypothetical protein
MGVVAMLSYRRLLACALRSFGILALLLLGSDCGVLTSDAAEVTKQDSYVKPGYLIDFSSYTGGSVDAWLNGHGYKLERDAKNSKLLGLSIIDRVFNIEAKARMSGFILNDHVNLENVKTIKLTWGVKKYPKDVSYDRHVNNEALMLYIFFGKEKIPSGHVLVPNSPYFIGLFLCQDDQVNYPYVGRYFHTGGRFVCLGKPQPGETISTEFNLDEAFKSYFSKKETPGITGIGFGVDTSKAGDGGRGAAFIKSIRFTERDKSEAR